ncbi:MAG: acetate--CoA ligase family protein [Anaerolineae bacterium]|nr:acetate--CoA ligase family protein [Anaerolineae bacterium]
MDFEVLNGLLRPKSVAVIGASNTPGKIGYLAVKNLIDCDYPGDIYPINPKEAEIQGLPAYPSVLEVPGEIDTAMLIVPAARTLTVTEECGQKGVKGLIVVASGYSEIGRKDLEDELVGIARRYGMRLLGPNIVGIMCNSDKCNASFGPFMPLPGKAAMISQSGALLIAMTVASYVRNVGFDKMISVGNMADVNFGDLVQWLDQDEQTTCITIYVEGFQNGRRFLEIARKAHKPIVALKSGVSAHGAAAAASHTGAMAGKGKVYDAALEQAGVVRASDLNNLFDRTLALSLQPPMAGNNLMIISNGGGVGVLAADAAEHDGIPLRFAPDDLQTALRAYVPEIGSVKNPADLTGMGGWPEYLATVRAALQHPWVHGLVVLFCETQRNDPMDIAEAIKRAVDESGVTDKPIAVSFIGGEEAGRAMQWLVEHGIPTYGAPDIAVNAVAALHEYAQMHGIGRDGEPVTEEFTPYRDVDTDAARAIIAQARAAGRVYLSEIESKKVFAAYGLPVAITELATTEDTAVQLAETMGYPVVLKIMSPDILHKSDAGGVKINLRSADEVRAAYRTILDSARAYKPDAHIHGVAVQQMAPSGTEVILGSINDPTFGPTVMFGLGGIFIEILKDVTFRVAPISAEHALAMLADIQGAPLLAGARGEAPRDRVALAEALSRYSQMIMDLGDGIAESDANPVLVYAEKQGLKVVDARIILTTP